MHVHQKLTLIVELEIFKHDIVYRYMIMLMACCYVRYTATWSLLLSHELIIKMY